MSYINANWDVPRHVHAVTTTRQGGVSDAPYYSLNVGDHVGDEVSSVIENRRRICESLDIKTRPLWLSQVHGINVVPYEQASVGEIRADGCYTNQKQKVCVVMTADCLPVALYNHTQDNIAVVHAGWKGLAAGIIAEAAVKLGEGIVSAWLGPAIGPQNFEVGDEVRTAFVSKLPQHCSAFEATGNGKWLADLYELARQQLDSLGISQVFGGNYCTYRDSNQFYSYRRDQLTGRMATLVWLDF